MKTLKSILNLLLVIALTAFLAACGGGETGSLEKVLNSGDLAKLQEKRTEILVKKDQFVDQLEQLDAAIAKLDSNENFPLVTVSEIEPQRFDHYVEVQGDVTTDQNLLIYPEFQGILNKVHVKAGETVTKGQLLASISDGGLREQLQTAEIQAELAKTTYEKQERLWKENIGSEMQYLNAKTNAEATQKTVEQLREQLDKTQVKAPFNGIIDDVIADEGQLLAPGQSAILRIVNLSDMYIKSDVPETYLATVTKGKKVLVEFPVLDTVVESKISMVSNHINPNNRTYSIEVDVANSKGMIKPNLMAKLKINDYTNEKAILVPQSLISENSAGDQYLYKAELKSGGKTAIAKKSIIKTGLKEGDFIEVIEGLEPNDVVIQEGARTVKDNQEVEIIR